MLGRRLHDLGSYPPELGDHSRAGVEKIERDRGAIDVTTILRWVAHRTIDIRKGFDDAGLKEIIEHLFLYYGEGPGDAVEQQGVTPTAS